MPQQADDNVEPPAAAGSQNATPEPGTVFSEEQILTLTCSVEAFLACPAAALRRQISIGFLAVCGAFAVAAVALGYTVAGAAAVALALLTLLGYFLVTGVAGKNYLFTRMRRFVLSGGVWNWVTFFFGVAAIVGVVAMLNRHELSLGLAVAALGFAVSMHVTLDRQLAAQRRRPLQQAEQMLKALRRGGVSEEALRQFVCQHGGDTWEPFFEALFDYEAMISARRRWGRDELGRVRPKHRAWRDGIINWLDARRPVPPPPEAPPEAPPQAPPQAASTSDTAPPGSGESATAPPLPPGVGTEAAAWPGVPGVSAEAQVSAEEAARPDRERRLWGPHPRGPLAFLLGARTRFVLGVLLLGACVLWMQQNQQLSSTELKQLGQQLIGQQQPDNDNTDTPDEPDAAATTQPAPAETTRPLILPHLPGPIDQWLEEYDVTRWFDNYGVGVAGLILIFSSFFRGIKIALFIFPAACAAMFGHRWGIPPMWIFSQQHVGMAAGVALMVLGVVFGQVRQ